MSLKILLADDSLTAQNMGKKILTDAGYEVIAVSNGAQAMKKILSDKPDLVVLDVYMPGYSGVELCEHMRKTRETAQTPVVLSVGKMEAFKSAEGTRVRADGLIVKPFEATELLALVKKLAEKISPAPRPKRQPEAKRAPEAASEDTPAPAEPDFQVQRQSVEVPQEIAAVPVIGMDLIPQEPQRPAPVAEFEVQHDPAFVEPPPDPPMASAPVLPDVFEPQAVSTAATEVPAPPTPVAEFDGFPAPFEAPALSQQVPEAAAAEGGTTTTDEHPLPDEAAQTFGDAGVDPQSTPVADTWPAPMAAITQECPGERVDHAQPEASSESETPHSPLVLPELASWDEPAAPADRDQLGWAPQDSASLPSQVPVWVAEEVAIQPDEYAVPLHQQMQREATASQMPEPAPSAIPAVSAETPVPSWEVPEPFRAEQDQREADVPSFNEPAIPQGCEPPQEPSLAADEQPESGSADPQSAHSEPEPQSMPASEAQAASPDSEVEHYAAAAPQLVPQTSTPTVTEAAVDPARVARIVDQVLERLKPELIAAVTRELEKNRDQ